ncbi:serum basic protease inhibitor-like [Physella acuta]|uniref:serum basic protease inhibitor-like n=1 Tax=Physella acuta TaxID=109671 RepID=UPI0027DD5554|nr:serum basic protease inhibitor-like [Physella acuta]
MEGRLVFVVGLLLAVGMRTTIQQAPELCLSPPLNETCIEGVERYFFNATAWTCETFMDASCIENKNSFETFEDCIEVCDPPNGQ